MPVSVCPCEVTRWRHSPFRLAPRHAVAVRGGVLTLVSLVIAPAFSFNRLSSSLSPPATLAVRGRFLTVIYLILAPASSFNRLSSAFFLAS